MKLNPREMAKILYQAIIADYNITNKSFNPIREK